MRLSVGFEWQYAGSKRRYARFNRGCVTPQTTTTSRSRTLSASDHQKAPQYLFNNDGRHYPKPIHSVLQTSALVKLVLDKYTVLSAF